MERITQLTTKTRQTTAFPSATPSPVGTRTAGLTPIMTLLAAGLVSISATSGVYAAAITVANSQASGEILAASGNESSSFSYNSNSDFLAVVITIAASSGLNVASNPTVTYNGDALTFATSMARSANHSAVFYLANPAQGANNLIVDFGADVLAADTGAWEFGAISLTNVDLANPVAHASSFNANGVSTVTLTSPSTGAISEGDFLLIGNAVDNIIPSPNWTTATGSQTTFYNNTAPTGAGNRKYQAQFGVVAAGDLSGVDGDQIILNTSQNRVGARSAVVFNVIPEPGTLALLGLGGLMMLSRRGR